MFSLPLAVSAAAVLLTFLAAAWQDWKTRTVYRATWYPAAAVGFVCAGIFWILNIQTAGAAVILLISVVFAALCWMFAVLGMFGKADAKALVLLSLAVPVTPFAAWIFPSLAVSTLVNAGILSLAVPFICLGYNLIKGNRAPFWLMCSGMPVAGVSVKDKHGFLAEIITEKDGKIEKEFVKAKDSVFSLKKPMRHTRYLRESPEEYAEILRLLEKCEEVWITVGIPLLVPLTAGLILALFGVSAVDMFLLFLL